MLCMGEKPGTSTAGVGSEALSCSLLSPGPIFDMIHSVARIFTEFAPW